jgi:formate dehydrogenase subunit delta
MSHDRLITMANQIGKFFAHEGPARAPGSIAQHIEQFWTQKMRAQIVAHLRAGGAGLDPLPKAAVEIIAHAEAAMRA